MEPDNNAEWLCDQCENPVKETDPFCARCGAVFDNRLFCSYHHSNEAIGVCVICQQPFCNRCGGKVDEVFFCGPHSTYETREGMARLHWNRATTTLQFITSCLEQAGLHPFIFADVEVFVPYAEVTQSEAILKELGFAIP